MAIRDVRLDCGAKIDFVWGKAPHREIWLLIAHSSLPYGDVKDQIFGANQRIVPSKHSAGFAVLFEIDGWDCGCTADSPEADISSAFCGQPRTAAPAFTEFQRKQDSKS